MSVAAFLLTEKYHVCTNGWRRSLLVRVRGRDRVRVIHILRGSLLVANLMGVIESMAQRRDSMDDSFQLVNFPLIAWVNPSALPNNNINYAIGKTPTQVHCNFMLNYHLGGLGSNKKILI